MKMIAQLTVDVAYIKTNMVQKSQSNRAATTFVKVKNEEEFQDFIKSLENQDQVDLLVRFLFLISFGPFLMRALFEKNV